MFIRKRGGEDKIMFPFISIDNSSFRCHIKTPILAPTYDIHVNFDPRLLGGVFKKSSLIGQLIEMNLTSSLPSYDVHKTLSLCLKLTIDWASMTENNKCLEEEDFLLCKMKEESKFLEKHDTGHWNSLLACTRSHKARQGQ